MDATKIIDPTTLQISGAQLAALYPFLAVFAGAVAAIIMAGVPWLNRRGALQFVSILALLVSGYFSLHSLGADRELMFSGMMVSDAYSQFFNVLFAVIGIITLLLSARYLDRENLHYPEFYILTLFSVLGMMLLSASTDFIVLFISLEIMSLCVYVLTGFRRHDRKSNEAAMKYFILGAAASAILLYGAALLYGATGSMNVLEIVKLASAGTAMSPMFTIGAWLVIVGFLFKVAAVPFHMWMPDVYEGAPTPVTGFMTTGIKAASFAIFVRVLLATGYGKDTSAALSASFQQILWVIVALTMLFGNVIALTQMNLKRMLAYSSIAHTGYLILGMIAAPYSESGFAPVVMYLVTYSIMNLGAFGILTVLSSKGDTDLSLQNLAGLSRRHPWLAFAMAVFMFSMSGIPPTAGFVSKYFLFYSAIQAKLIWLVVVGVLCSAISLYYYLLVLVYMYMRDPVEERDTIVAPFLPAFAVALMVIITLQVGVLPTRMMDFTKRVVLSLYL